MQWPKKNSYKEFDDKKRFLLLENSPPPPPHNFSNCPTLTIIISISGVSSCEHCFCFNLKEVRLRKLQMY